MDPTSFPTSSRSVIPLIVQCTHSGFLFFCKIDWLPPSASGDCLLFALQMAFLLIIIQNWAHMIGLWGESPVIAEGTSSLPGTCPISVWHLLVWLVCFVFVTSPLCSKHLDSKNLLTIYPQCSPQCLIRINHSINMYFETLSSMRAEAMLILFTCVCLMQ